MAPYFNSKSIKIEQIVFLEVEKKHDYNIIYMSPSKSYASVSNNDCLEFFQFQDRGLLNNPRKVICNLGKLSKQMF